MFVEQYKCLTELPFPLSHGYLEFPWFHLQFYVSSFFSTNYSGVFAFNTKIFHKNILPSQFKYLFYSKLKLWILKYKNFASSSFLSSPSIWDREIFSVSFSLGFYLLYTVLNHFGFRTVRVTKGDWNMKRFKMSEILTWLSLLHSVAQKEKVRDLGSLI